MNSDQFLSLCNLGDHEVNKLGTIKIYGNRFHKSLDKSGLFNHLFLIFDEAIIISKENYYKDKFLLEVYLKGITFNNIDIELFKEITVLLELRYKDKLETCYIFDPPIIFTHIWKIISKFLKNSTKDKVNIIHRKKKGSKMEYI